MLSEIFLISNSNFISTSFPLLIFSPLSPLFFFYILLLLLLYTPLFFCTLLHFYTSHFFHYPPLFHCPPPFSTVLLSSSIVLLSFSICLSSSIVILSSLYSFLLPPYSSRLLSVSLPYSSPIPRLSRGRQKYLFW